MNLLKIMLITSLALLFIHCNDDDDNSGNADNVFINCCNTSPLEVDFNPGRIYVPNIFTPNNDGINDLFHVYSDEDIVEVEEFKILNTEGELVFESFSFPPNDNSENSWVPNNDVENGSFQVTGRVRNVEGNSFAFSGFVCLFRCNTLNPFTFTDDCGFATQHNGLGGQDETADTKEVECP